jgi:SAM-dependent methyltransferase
MVLTEESMMRTRVVAQPIEQSLFCNGAALQSNRAVSSSDFVQYIRDYCEFDSKTIEFVEEGITYFINEFWTSAQRAAHSIHEISYRACFKPQLPAFFIDRLTSSGDIVLDPFMGRGTTPIEAHLRGRIAFGNDINPLSLLLTRPRLRVPEIERIQHILDSVSWKKGEIERDDLLVFYHPSTLRQLCALRDWLIREAPLTDTNPDPAVDWIRMVALNRLTGHSPGFFSVRTMPPNQAVSIDAQRKINEKNQQEPREKNVAKLIMKKTKSLLSDGVPKFSRDSILLCGAADRLSKINDGIVSLIVTSPPFLDVVQYADDNWLRCWFAHIDIDSIDMAMHRDELVWQAMVKDVLKEAARVLKDGGHVAFEVGEVRGGKLLLEKLVWWAAEDLPFERVCVIVNEQSFTKTSNCWGVANNAKGTNSNRIVLLRRIPR